MATSLTTSPNTIEQFVDVMNRNILEKDYFRNIYDQAPEEYSELVQVQSTPRPFNIYTGYQGIARPQRNRDLESIPQRSSVKSNKSTILQVPYRSGITIEKFMIEAAEHRQVLDNMRDFVESEKTLRDAVAADVYNNGFSVQPYDFVESADNTQRPLFSSAHKREDNGATYSNYINSALPPNISTLFSIMATMKRYTDNVGNFIAMNATFTMLIPSLQPDWMKAAREIVDSMDDPETSDRSINALKREFQIGTRTINNFTSNGKWFLRVDTGKRWFPVRMEVFREPEFSPLINMAQGGNPDAYYSRLRSYFGVGLFGSARGVFAVGA